MTAGRAVAAEQVVLATELNRTDQAWEVRGATPGIGDSQRTGLAGRLPYAVGVQRDSSPPWVAGLPAAEITSDENLERLRVAFEGLDAGRVAWSFWGAVRDDVSETPPWRVMTRSVVLTDEGWAAVGGNPEALLGWPEEWSNPYRSWLGGSPLDRFEDAAPLPPILLESGSAVLFDDDRLRRIDWLAARLTDYLGSTEAVADVVAVAYEALHWTRRGEYVGVLLLEKGDNTSRLLARLVWLTLPIEDRRTVSFNTDVREIGLLRHALSVAREEKLTRIPDGWLIFRHLPDASAITPVRRYWARWQLGLEGQSRTSEHIESRISLLVGDEATRWFEMRTAKAEWLARGTSAAAIEWLRTAAAWRYDMASAECADLASAVLTAATVDTDPHALLLIWERFRTMSDDYGVVRRVAAVIVEQLAQSTQDSDRSLAGFVVCRDLQDRTPLLDSVLFQSYFGYEDRAPSDTTVARALLATPAGAHDLAMGLKAALSLRIVSHRLVGGWLGHAVQRHGDYWAAQATSLRAPQSEIELVWSMLLLESFPEAQVATVGDLYLHWVLPLAGSSLGAVAARHHRLVRVALRRATPEQAMALFTLTKPDAIDLVAFCRRHLHSGSAASEYRFWVKLIETANESPASLDSQLRGETWWPGLCLSGGWNSDNLEEASHVLMRMLSETESEQAVAVADLILETRSGVHGTAREFHLMEAAIDTLVRTGRFDGATARRLRTAAAYWSAAAASWAQLLAPLAYSKHQWTAELFAALTEAAARDALTDEHPVRVERFLWAWWLTALSSGAVPPPPIRSASLADEFGLLVRALEQSPPWPLYVACRHRLSQLVETAPTLTRGASRNTLDKFAASLAPVSHPAHAGDASVFERVHELYRRFLPWKYS